MRRLHEVRDRQSDHVTADQICHQRTWRHVRIQQIQQHAERPAQPCADCGADRDCEKSQRRHRSEEHTSELQSLMRISYAVFCLKKKKKKKKKETKTNKKFIHDKNKENNNRRTAQKLARAKTDT